MSEKNKFDDVKSFLEKNIFLREHIIFISKILKRINEDKLEDYKPSTCVVEGRGQLYEREFRVFIEDCRTLNIPYEAVEKIWKDDSKKINIELNLMIVLDEKVNSLKLEPMHNILAWCKHKLGKGVNMSEKNKFDDAKTFLKENIFPRKDVIFISKILKRINEDKLEDYKPSTCVVEGCGELYDREFRVFIGDLTLNIPYDAVEKKWKDTSGKINIELNLMIVLDEKVNSLKLEPMYNLLTLQDFCKLLNNTSDII